MVFSLFFYGQGLLIKMRKEFVILENEALLGELYAYLGLFEDASADFFRKKTIHVCSKYMCRELLSKEKRRRVERS